MPTLGTKKFWKPASGSATTQKENQIIKNSGYINIQLVSVNYMSKGNFWQKTFGGKDKIALATSLEYQSGVESIEATAVQDVREVKVNSNRNLGLQRNIAVKVPASANAISLDVRMTAVKNDMLQAKFDMLNKPQYQSALQLAPTAVGQVLTITSLVKKLLTDSDPASQLDAKYAGIISAQAEDHPIAGGKLTKGLLIMISTDEGEPFSDVEESKFELKGDALYYDNAEVMNTYVLFNISFDPFKGDDENSNWFNKYNEALNNLDKIELTDDVDERKKLFGDSKTFWIEGNALLEADSTYINSEKNKIKTLAIKLINDKYLQATRLQSSDVITSREILQSVFGTSDRAGIEEALPFTARSLHNSSDLKNPSRGDLTRHLVDDERDILESLNRDADTYLTELKNENIDFHLAKGFSTAGKEPRQTRDPLLEGYGFSEKKDMHDACDAETEFVGGMRGASTCVMFPRPWVGKKWRAARSLKVLIEEVNRLAPQRDKRSDGTIGDVAHSQRDSDHNPWVLDDGATGGIVTAMDISHDPLRGCDCNILTQSLQSSKDKRIKYVIWNHKIMSSTVQPWTWRPYGGGNPHTKHIHLSVNCDRASCDSIDPWNIRVK